ncbi:MAG: DUF4349 domain-containing protein [Acidobacteria bacterium]|nr:DUF4349 domain-containing protein [Acidobacteriota bacterium]MBI3424788.1 DUF4349 domain-containing protein [Acidobacteriota bacterium]
MRFASVIFCGVLLLAVVSCNRRPALSAERLNQGAITYNQGLPAATKPEARAGDDVAYFKEASGSEVPQQGQPRTQTAPSTHVPLPAVAQAFDRKIIRNANLDIELDNPADAQRQLTTIAETLGGFVVTSEARVSASNASAPGNVVTVTVRVPSTQFNAAIEKLRGLGGRILQEKISGQDVTEEYIDLEARARTQRALEAQMLDILKRAGKISDALEVQNQIATVRTEIERLEGRQRFLANQAALSTINITLHTPTPIVIATTAQGFWHQVKQAVGDGIDLASNITLGIIQFVIMLIPILLLIVLPLWLVWRLARPHVHWPKKTMAAPPSDSAAVS